ncbi:MAG: 16S rRNA (adenine(1518)-N(6)/adenine(1519)-N(6))-dimethyltransferase RsmA [Acidimicrobiia bacterium]|nr:16S rRNA (adenine(1518)-N(6)/adenine(1519)-N(6))-dimethyltransferase RsmA [Acidimicrobiia bacterium]
MNGDVALLGVREVKARLAEAGVRPSRYRGQNFLADPNLVRRIVRLARAGPADRVIEVGVGVGSLTAGLVAAGATVTGIEIEPSFCELVAARLPADRVEIICADAVSFDWASLETGDRVPTKLVANLPYSVGTTVLLDVLAVMPSVRSAVVMVQEEVALRLCARPGTRDYGAVTVKLDTLADAHMLGSVPARVFVPRPEVTSALVGLERGRNVEGEAERDRVWQVVDAGFATRRKTLRNALLKVWSGGDVDAAMHASGIDGRRRAESLSTDEFRALARELGGRGDTDA